jgi:hypothetical protein
MKTLNLFGTAAILLAPTIFWACTETTTEPQATYLSDSTLANPNQFQNISGTIFVEKGVRLEKGMPLKKRSQSSSEMVVVYPDAKPLTGRYDPLSEFIQNATIIASKKANAKCPTGYQKANIDLNKGSGGKFVFLCVTYDISLNQMKTARFDLYNSGAQLEFRDTISVDTTTNGDTTLIQYFYGSTFVQTNSVGMRREWKRLSPSLVDDKPVGPHYYVITLGSSNGDLNQDASGDYIWLVGKEGHGTVRNIAVVSGSSSEITCPTGFEKLTTTLNGVSGDLNNNAGGYFMYLCQQF